MYRQGSFNPRTPCGVRPISRYITTTVPGFNPRTPCGVRLAEALGGADTSGFNPRTPCGVRRGPLGTDDADPTVSIHALLAECDRKNPCLHAHPVGFNPRTPCGVRLPIPPSPPPGKRFQSTHSLRSATALNELDMVHMWVSIHALLAECDYSWHAPVYLL